MGIKRKKIGLLLLFLSALSTMALIPMVDRQWTLFLRNNRMDFFGHIMDRTLFEGEGLGGGDPVIFFLIFVLVCYFFSWKKGVESKLYLWRPQLGFIITAAMTCSFITVHSLKWIIGRARPTKVFRDDFLYTNWYEFGAHYITEGTYRGSFPSGHTAQAFAVMTLAYVLVALPGANLRARLFGWIFGVAGMLYTLMMGVSRCMTFNHWLSDVLGAIFLSWIIMHLIYFKILNIPLQTAWFSYYGRHPAAPLMWELRLCVYISGIALAMVMIFFGYRALLLNAPFYLLFLMPAGVLLLFFSIRAFRNLRGIVTGLYSNIHWI